MKRFIIFFMLLLSLTFTSQAFADNEINLKIDDKAIETDVSPKIIDGRTMVPVRVIFEGVGADVEWNSQAKTIIGSKGDVTVEMSIDNNIAKVNNNNVSMDCAPVIIDGRTLAPARYVAEAFGCKVDWDNESKTVNIVTSFVDLKKPEIVSAETTAETTTDIITETTTFETTTNPMYNYEIYYKPGTYAIGTDIPAGEYVVFANPNSIGYVYEYSKDGDVGNTGKRYLYSKYFDYCDIVRLDSGNYVDLTNAYAIPGEGVSLDTSHNGTYRVGKDIKTGHLTFKLSPESDIGYIDIGLPDAKTSDRTIVYLTRDKDSVVVNVTAGMYIKIFSCDVLDENLVNICTYKPVTENDSHTDANYNFDDITPSVKKYVDDFLTTLVSELNAKSFKSTKYTDPYFKKTVEGWNGLAKTSADRKYIDIAKSVYNNIKSYAYGTNGDVAYANTIKLNGNDISGFAYRDILDSEKDFILNAVNEFKSGVNFEEIEVANKNLTNFRYDIPRLNGTKVN